MNIEYVIQNRAYKFNFGQKTRSNHIRDDDFYSKRPEVRFGLGWGQNTFLGARAGNYRLGLPYFGHPGAGARAEIGKMPPPALGIHGAGNPSRLLVS